MTACVRRPASRLHSIEISTTIDNLDDFKALDPSFRIIEDGLYGLADGGHFFDLLAEDVVFDFIITTPGYPTLWQSSTLLGGLRTRNMS